MTNAIDLTSEQRKTLNDLLRRFLPGVVVWAYGSRVKWTAHPNSDLDLVAFTTPAQRSQVADLKDALAESNLPFPVDLHVWDDVPERFLEIIRKEYVVVQGAKPLEGKAGKLSEWREVSVDEIKAPSENALATGPFGSSIGSRFFKATGIPVIRGSNLSEDIGTRLNDEGLVFLTPDKAQEFSRSTVREGDLVFTCWGTVNQIGLIDGRATYREYVISNKQMKLTPDRAKADSLFLYYLFSSPDLQDRIKNEAIGSSVPGFNLGQLRAMRLVIPELDEQRAIAHILGTLDDKIELNRWMNETLEAMARALFKSWFVDFDPVRAKAEGRDIDLPKPIADLFPDSLEESELGEIPRGWVVTSVGDLCRRIAMGPFGSDIKTDNFVEFGVPVVRGLNLTKGFVEEGFVYVSDKKADELRNANAFPGDLVITHRGTLGQVGLISERSRFPRYVVSQSQMLLSVNRDVVTPRYVFDFLRSAAGQHALLANTSQTGVPAIARPTSSVRAIRLVVPPIQVLRHFNRLVDPIYSQRDGGIEESHTLATLRDTLLPKLISGEISVSRLSNG